MKVGIIGEGETEFRCVPSLAAQFGHVTVGVTNLGGIGSLYPWEKVMRSRVYPFLRGFAVKDETRRPDKVLIIIDRDRRAECCGALAASGSLVLAECLSKENLQMEFVLVIPNPTFESWLFADPLLLDSGKMFTGPVSHILGDDMDEKNVLKVVEPFLATGIRWDKPRFGKALAQKINLTDPGVQKRSRSLRKFVKELTS